MDDERFDDSTREVAGATGRRAAILTFGAAAAALLTAYDLADAEAKRGRRGRKGKQGKRGKRGRSGRRGRSGPPGIGDSVDVAGNVASLPVVSVIGDQATSVASCDGGSVLLGCGLDVFTNGVGTTPAAALDNTVSDVVPDADAATCTATLTRTGLISGQITAAAQIQAYAICSA
ncbi:MAG: hypothetical protein K0Q71_2796 [Thermomicrobiales bacterium]|jgi:hypothetical protein|nr:hypothetical protein [Thermomicrobiales bacterium]